MKLVLPLKKRKRIVPLLVNMSREMKSKLKQYRREAPLTFCLAAILHLGIKLLVDALLQ